MVSGLICSLAGVLYTFRLDTAVQNNGLGLELDVVAIVLLAGVSIFGGKGSIIGVVLAVLAFAGIQNALLLTQLQPGSDRASSPARCCSPASSCRTPPAGSGTCGALLA